jgi:hypothetical protein
MIDFLWALVKILIIDFILFQGFNKYLVKCLATETLRNWTIAYAVVALLLPVFSNLLNQSPTFAFFLALSFITLLSGFSSNYKESELLHEMVEAIQKKTIKYAIFASVVGYISYAEFH